MLNASAKTHENLPEGQDPLTFLARGFEFQGTLTFEGTVRIDGSVAGEIHARGTVILGEHAVIEGDVSAGTIVSGGTIMGNVRATRNVHLLQTAVLRGTVVAPLVRIDEGASVHGTCEADGRIENKNPDGRRAGAQAALTIRMAHRGEAR